MPVQLVIHFIAADGGIDELPLKRLRSFVVQAPAAEENARDVIELVEGKVRLKVHPPCSKC